MDDRAISQAVSSRLLTAKARVRAQVSPCGICGGHSDSGTGLSPRLSVFPFLISFHRCSILIHVSSGVWTMGPLAALFHRDIVSPHRNNE
jgi:hypothetical protein